MHGYRHVILHLPAKFRVNQMIVGGVMTSYPFSRWRPAAILDLMWVMLDHPRSAIVGISSGLKFGLDPIYSFGEIAIFIFRRFGLKLPIHAHFWDVLGAYFPQIWSPTVLTPKRHPQKALPYAETCCLSHKAWKSVQRFDRGAGSRKKGQGQDRSGQDRTVKQKSHKVVIFRPYGEKPPLHRLEPKFAWCVASPT